MDSIPSTHSFATLLFDYINEKSDDALAELFFVMYKEGGYNIHFLDENTVYVWEEYEYKYAPLNPLEYYTYFTDPIIEALEEDEELDQIITNILGEHPNIREVIQNALKLIHDYYVENNHGYAVMNRTVDHLPLPRDEIINLKDLSLRDRDKSDLWTFETPYHPLDLKKNISSENLTRYIKTLCCENKNIMNTLQSVIGYTLTGRNDENFIYVFPPVDKNGVSTFIEIFRRMLGADNPLMAGPFESLTEVMNKKPKERILFIKVDNLDVNICKELMKFHQLFIIVKDKLINIDVMDKELFVELPFYARFDSEPDDARYLKCYPAEPDLKDKLTASDYSELLRFFLIGANNWYKHGLINSSLR